MAEHTPRVSWWALGLMLCALSVQVVARYKWGFLEDKDWQFLHVLLGWGLCLGIFALFHGARALRLISRRTWVVLGIGLTCLLLFWYFGRSDGYRRFFGNPPLDHTTFWPIVPFLYFASMATILRLVIPFSIASRTLGLPPRELGLGLAATDRSVKGIGWIYLALAIGIAPFVVHAAGTAVFQQKYPLARDLIDPDGGVWFWHLVVYQAFYFLVFLSGESFWRGFLTFGMERDFGLYALPLMCVPYVTGHFGKPFSETLGAVLAGAVLGFLALRHRSVWFGVALHYAVALSMDLLAIHAQGAVIYFGGG
jgi:membrane protease YdiL (CAAX protease family)